MESTSSLSDAPASPGGRGGQFQKTLVGDLAAIQREYASLCRIRELPEGPPGGLARRARGNVGDLVEAAGSICFSLQFEQETAPILYVHADSRGFTILNGEALVSTPPPADEPKLDLASLASPFESFEQLLAGLRPHAFERFQTSLISAQLEAELSKQTNSL
ncbi:hypothetical protein BESB_025710 [Besnoitia besnoiti]|uniref:GSKIP domain-containing protein n=1 Tax=Besnoitia besnoiti TaxID=94643 RepID=A0A2A9M7H1_BESBE|nr:uncharacterized protein BESB_025710 [Besnoitia besnoiti]PFH31597.1 hypothetical protein BESB_025710 [Besnoitia besnoiti]